MTPVTRQQERVAAIARLDAELKESDAQRPPLVQRFGYLVSSVVGGWMLGGALAGPAGMTYCAGLGLVVGAYRAVYNQSLLEFLSDGELSSSGSQLQSKFSDAAAPMKMPSSSTSTCGGGNGKTKPPC